MTHIRLVQHFQYLGATVCYHNFERATTLARIKASEKTGQQLHRWLHSTWGLNGQQKYKIWKQCVFTTLRYSLMAIGFTHQTATKYNLTDPLLHLVAFCQDAQVRDVSRRHQLRPTDVLLRAPMMNYDQQMQVLTTTWYHLRQNPSWYALSV